MAEASSIPAENRIYFLDNLRTFMIFLVVLLHTGLVYESSGISAFFWIVDDPATNDLSGIINLIVDVFVMSTIFFVSGFFAPLSLKNKEGRAFLRTKFNRLMVPWAVAVLTLIPLYKIMFLYSRNLPQENWTTYFHWSNGIWNQNWLWFLPVLFLFNVLYFIFSRMNMTLPTLSLKGATLAIFLCGLVYSFLMDTYKLQGWTKTFFLDFQNERLLIYLMIFLLGALCYKLKIFESKSTSKGFYILINCVAWIPVSLYLLLIIFAFIKPGQVIFSETGDRLIRWTSFHLSLLSMLYLMVATFRFYVNKPGKIWKALNQSSYGVYIIHTIILGALALAMLNRETPSLLKYLVVAVSTYAVSNLLIYSYRTVMKSKVVFKRKELAART